MVDRLGWIAPENNLSVFEKHAKAAWSHNAVVTRSEHFCYH